MTRYTTTDYLSALKSGSVFGPGPPHILGNAASTICPVLRDLCNLSSYEVPISWKNAMVIPFFKKNDS